jgi:membrane dipeptidase
VTSLRRNSGLRIVHGSEWEEDVSPTAAAAHAAELHRQAIVIDGHSDILCPIADGKTRLSERVVLPDPETWQPPPGVTGHDEFRFSAHSLFFGPMGQYDIPRFVEGGVTVQVCAIYAGDHELDHALHRGLEMAWCLHREAEEVEGFDLVTSVADIHRLKREGRSGAILALEGCDVLGSDARMLDLYYKLGLRMASLTHCRRNWYADGPQPGVSTGGLTASGRRLVERMNELGIVVDLVHINEIGFWEILELTTAPVVLSHSSGTMFSLPVGLPYGAPGSRPGLDASRDRKRLEAIAGNGGVLGIIFFEKVDIDDVVTDIETALEIMGPEHVGLGSDYFGLELAPEGLEDIGKLPLLTRRLVERGHTDEVILRVLGGNYLRLFEQVWK